MAEYLGFGPGSPAATGVIAIVAYFGPYGIHHLIFTIADHRKPLPRQPGDNDP